MILIRYHFQHILTKITFTYTSVPKLYAKVFPKTLQLFFILFFFVSSCLFSYFQRLGKEQLNSQESICEKIHLVTVYLQDNNFHFLV